MSVLVAGGTGYLGTAVVRELIASGYSVSATFIVERERERLAPQDVELIRGGLFGPGAAAAALAAVDDLEAVVNLVGGYAVGPHVHETEPEQFERLMRLNVTPA